MRCDVVCENRTVRFNPFSTDSRGIWDRLPPKEPASRRRWRGTYVFQNSPGQDDRMFLDRIDRMGPFSAVLPRPEQLSRRGNQNETLPRGTCHEKGPVQ